MDEPLETILAYYDAHLQAWYNQMEVAIVERNRFFNPDNISHSAHLRSWMLTTTTAHTKKASRYRRVAPFLRALCKRSTKFKKNILTTTLK